MNKQEIKEQIKKLQYKQYRASQKRNATQVFKIQRQLETLYKKLDNLK